MLLTIDVAGNTNSMRGNMMKQLLHLDINSQIGSCMSLGDMRIGTTIHNIEMNPSSCRYQCKDSEKKFPYNFTILWSVFTIRVYFTFSMSCQKCIFDNLDVDTPLGINHAWLGGQELHIHWLKDWSLVSLKLSM